MTLICQSFTTVGITCLIICKYVYLPLCTMTDIAQKLPVLYDLLVELRNAQKGFMRPDWFHQDKYIYLVKEIAEDDTRDSNLREYCQDMLERYY